MAAPSPPKPWEKGGATGASSALSALSTIPNTQRNNSTTSPPSTDPPPLPQRPSTLNSVVNRTASNYTPYGANRFGTPGYSPLGSYGTPYSRFGGGGMYGGYGSYGGLYGGVGGVSGLGYGMGGGFGAAGMPNDPNSLTNTLSQSTQATFQIIESIVGAFGGFAQMLESTYMATHSSFFAMVSVAEQFGNLRNTLGSLLGIFTLLRWLRSLFAKLTGRPLPASSSANELTLSNFAAFASNNNGPTSSTPARPSRKPFLVFLVAVFGLPYLMGKLIRALVARTQEDQQNQMTMMSGAQQQVLDPSKLDFCRVLYDYAPEPGATASAGIDELAVKKGDLVAVLSRSDPLGNPSEWWRCRARDGRQGYLPAPYLEVLLRRGNTPAAANTTDAGAIVDPAAKKKGDLKAITSASQAGSSRAASLTTVSTGLDAAAAAAAAAAVSVVPPAVQGSASDISVESFQRSQFRS